MPVNKVIYGTETLVDLTSDTVTTNTLLAGTTAHAKDGSAITGAVEFSKIYTGTEEPSNSLGNDGDLYLKTGG